MPSSGRFALVGNSAGRRARSRCMRPHERPDEVAGVVGLNPAERICPTRLWACCPNSFRGTSGRRQPAWPSSCSTRTPWLFWLVARDFARAWSSPTVQAHPRRRAERPRDRSLGIDVLSAIRAPVLILWGAQDRLLPASSAEDFRRNIPGAVVELIPDCGHIPQLEDARLIPRFSRILSKNFATRRRIAAHELGDVSHQG